MHKQLKIHNFSIDLSYQFDSYFNDTIEKYETTQLNQNPTKMTIEIEDHIFLPKEAKKVYQFKKPSSVSNITRNSNSNICRG